MNEEIKARWTADLRDNPDAQGHGALDRETPSGRKQCCLGRLCLLAVADGIIPSGRVTGNYGDGGGDGYYAYGENGEESYLPAEVVEWAGLPSHNPVVYTADFPRFSNLANLNDAALLPFSKIADLIAYCL